MILRDLGDEVRGARILCIYRKRGRDVSIKLHGKQRGRRIIIKGAPAQAIVEKPLRYKQ